LMGVGRQRFDLSRPLDITGQRSHCPLLGGDAHHDLLTGKPISICVALAGHHTKTLRPRVPPRVTLRRSILVGLVSQSCFLHHPVSGVDAIRAAGVLPQARHRLGAGHQPSSSRDRALGIWVAGHHLPVILPRSFPPPVAFSRTRGRVELCGGAGAAPASADRSFLSSTSTRPLLATLFGLSSSIRLSCTRNPAPFSASPKVRQPSGLVCCYHRAQPSRQPSKLPRERASAGASPGEAGSDLPKHDHVRSSDAINHLARWG